MRALAHLATWLPAALIAFPLLCLAQTTPRLTFEVASVKPSTAEWMAIAPQRSGGRITWQTDLFYLLSYAFHMDRWRISGPIPGTDFVYAVDAKMDPAASDDEVRLMMRSLLEDRFRMTSHLVSKEGNGYILSVAKGGPKMQEAPAESQPPPLPEWLRGASAATLEGKVVTTAQSRDIGNITGRRVSMAQFCGSLTRLLQTFVEDETSLKGNYYFAFRYARDDSEDTTAPKLPGALEAELGLKLSRKKGPIEMLVVDRIE